MCACQKKVLDLQIIQVSSVLVSNVLTDNTREEEEERAEVSVKDPERAFKILLVA